MIAAATAVRIAALTDGLFRLVLRSRSRLTRFSWLLRLPRLLRLLRLTLLLGPVGILLLRAILCRTRLLRSLGSALCLCLCGRLAVSAAAASAAAPVILRCGLFLVGDGGRIGGLGLRGRNGIGKRHVVGVNDLRQRLKFLDRLDSGPGPGRDRRKILRDGRIVFPRLAAAQDADIAVFVGADGLRMILHAHLDALPQEIDIRDGAAPVGRIDKGLILRRGAQKIFIGVLLVLEAAHQPPADAGNFGRIQAEILRLGHLDRDRLEIVEEFAAAEGPSADAESADHLRLVAHADLAQLNARAEYGGEVLDQLPEVHTPVGGEEEEQLAAVEGALRRDQLHFELVFRDLLQADVKGALLLFEIRSVDMLVLRRRKAEDLPQRRNDLRGGHLVISGGADAVFHAARGVHNDVVARGDGQLARIKEIVFCVVAETDVHDRDLFCGLRCVAIRCRLRSSLRGI